MILLLAVLAAQSADAAPHHHGLFLRLDFGIGYYDSSNSDTTISGGGAGLGVSLGGEIAENLALFGSFYYACCGSPTKQPPCGPQTVDVPCIKSSNVGGLGVGLNYYLMPANVFLSGTIGIGSVSVLRQTYHDKPAGVLARFGVGKEWFVSQSWGLGIAGYAWLGSNKDDVGGSAWTSLATLIAFSATFY